MKTSTFLRLCLITVWLVSFGIPSGSPAHAMTLDSQTVLWPFSHTSKAPRPQAPAPQKLHKIIIVDAGHGGIDGGASGGGLLEKDVTLDIARRVRAHLTGMGYDVRMTRDHDTDLSTLYPKPFASRHKSDLQNRLTFIRESRSVGFISIHANSSTNKADKGPLVFYTSHSEDGKQLATALQEAVNRIAVSTQRPVARTNLFLLRHAPCPAVLVEVGFLTNAQDVARLRDAAYREKMAGAIAAAAAPILRHTPIPPPYQKGSAVRDWAPPPLQ